MRCLSDGQISERGRRRAGARCAVDERSYGQTMCQRVLFERTDADGDPESLAQRYMRGMDIVIVEGFKQSSLPKIEVHSVRPTRRQGPDGQTMTDLVIEITQRRRAYLDSADQE